MPYRQKRLLLDEVARQCEFALIGYRDASVAVRKNESRQLWYALHALIGAAVHLHRLLGSSDELNGVLGEVPAALAQAELARAADWAELARKSSRARCSFDPQSAILVLFDAVFELQPLLAAIAELRMKAEAGTQSLRAVV